MASHRRGDVVVYAFTPDGSIKSRTVVPNGAGDASGMYDACSRDSGDVI